MKSAGFQATTFTMLVAMFVSTAAFAQDCENDPGANEMRQVVKESIRFNSNGTCDIDFKMTVSESPIASLYRELLDFPGQDHTGSIRPTASASDKEIPETVSFDAVLTLDQDATAEDDTTKVTSVTDGFFDDPYQSMTRNVRDEIITAFLDLHKFHFGIEEGAFGTITLAQRWGTDGECVIHVKAEDFSPQIVDGKIFIGPKDIDASIERIGFVLLQMEHIKTVLDPENTDFSSYLRCWTVAFDLSSLGPLTNQADLFRVDQQAAWHQEFGPQDGDNYLSASLRIPTASKVILDETFKVDENAITTTPKDLYLGGFLCYKTFEMEYEGGSDLGIVGLETGSIALSRNWTFSKIEGEYNVDFAENVPGVTAELSIYQNFETRFGIEWDWGWFFELDEFQTYLEIESTLDLDFNLAAEEYTIEPDNPFFEWDHHFVFTVWLIPVQITLNFDITGQLTFSLDPPDGFTYHAGANGKVRLGVKWDEDKGWRPLRRFDFDVESEFEQGFDPEDLTFTVDLGLPMTISALFYNLAGPSATLEPFSRLTVGTAVEEEHGDDDANNGECLIELDTGIRVAVGMDFIDLLEELGLEDVNYAEKEYVFWEYLDCEDGYHDVAVIDLIAPELVIYGDNVSVTATILNNGSIGKEPNVDATRDVESCTTVTDPCDGGTSLIETDTVFNDPNSNPPILADIVYGGSERVTFDWNTRNETTLPSSSDRIQFEVTADLDEGSETDVDASNDSLAVQSDWKVRDVFISEVTANATSVEQGDVIEIDVQVENHENGLDLGDVLVTVFYREDVVDSEWIPIGSVWCDFTRMIFDLPADTFETPRFLWDTSNVPVNTGNGYLIQARISMQPENASETEWDDTNNIMDLEDTSGDPINVYVQEADNDPPDAGLEFPFDGELGVDPLNPEFGWNGSGGEPGDEVTYQIYYAPIPAPLVIQGITTETNFTPDVPLIDGVLYAWRVDAVDSHGATASSEEWIFGTAALDKFVRGDVNGDGTVYALVEAIFLLAYVFLDEDAPPCMAAADADGNDVVFGLIDTLFLLEYGFRSGPEPDAPFPDCGPDPDTTLDCEVPLDGCLVLP